MVRNIIFALVATAAVTAPVTLDAARRPVAQRSAARRVAPPITANGLRRHIVALADDAMEGRAPGSAGETRATAYLSQAFTDAGLSPGGAAGGWMQPVALVEQRPASATMTVRSGGITTTVDPGDVVLFGGAPTVRIVDAPVWFVGFAVDRPGDGDLAGVDLSGAVALMLSGVPADTDPSRMPSERERRDALLRRGAKAVVVLQAEDDNWSGRRRSMMQGLTMRAGSRPPGVAGAIAFKGWSPFARQAGLETGNIRRSATAPGFRAVKLSATVDAAVTTSVRSYTSSNVIGRLAGRGTGPRETVVVTAHWDHLGLCRPVGAPDRICNGAVDNASGTATLIEMARALARGPRPTRDILFFATTAEEKGLLGASAFAADPPVPLSSIVAAINEDTVAIAPAGLPVAVLPRGATPSLDALADATAREMGRAVDGDTEANSLAHRQDGAALLEAGVPSVMVGGSFSDMKLLETYLEGGGPYHQPNDDARRPIELGGATEDANLQVALIRKLAEPALYPTPARPATAATERP